MSKPAEIGCPTRGGAIAQAVETLRKGGVIALPTDTLYGLGASVFDEGALRRVFEVKGRPAGMPLPVLVAGWGMVGQVAAETPGIARRLAEVFWPGPLTLVVPSAPALSKLVTGGGETVGVRSPDHWAPLGIIDGLGCPITGTSANFSGGPDLLDLESVRQQLGSVVDYIIEDGPAPLGTASTVVDATGESLRLLREGVIPFERILAAV